tara:strand:+ start:2433 stop:2897 length:465 start_codon:yes stop_codon:yes gene_type:complete
MTQQINTNRGNSSPKKKEDTTYIFVYGALRQGMGLNSILATSKRHGTHKTLPKYTMYDLGAFPCIINKGNTSIIGDLYEVTEDIVAKLDIIEGVPNLYKRGLIELDYDNVFEVQAYFWSYQEDDDVRLLDSSYKVISGDWIEQRGLIEQETDDE